MPLIHSYFWSHWKMDVTETVQKRNSIRAHQEKHAPKDKLKKILEAARLAPSAINIESWQFRCDY